MKRCETIQTIQRVELLRICLRDWEGGARATHAPVVEERGEERHEVEEVLQQRQVALDAEGHHLLVPAQAEPPTRGTARPINAYYCVRGLHSGSRLGAPSIMP